MPSDDRLEARYSRQILLRHIGERGQQRLGEQTVLILGCGALGSNQANLLARAGVGRIVLVDRDVVALSNLQRQMLFDEHDVADGLPKAEAAARHLRRINHQVDVEPRVLDVTPANIVDQLGGADLVLDASDNFETRYLLNDACVQQGLTWIYGGVIETQGMVLVIRPGDGPCLRCLFPEPPPPGAVPTCDTVGILNTLPALIAARQVTEAFKVLLGSPEVNPQLVQLDPWDNSVRQLTVSREPGCPACGKGDYTFLNVSQGSWVTSLCGRNAVQITPREPQPLDLAQLAETLKPAGPTTYNGLLLQFSVDDCELLIFPDGRVVVKGTTEESVARTLHARYLGG